MMKKYDYICLILSVVIFTNLANAQELLYETNKNSEKESVLSKDYETAEKALELAISNKDVKTIRIALKSSSYRFKIKIKAVNALKDIEGKNSIPSLIEALKNNRDIYSGGTETLIEQNELDRKIILALEALLEINFAIEGSYPAKEFEVSNYIPDEIIQRVIEATQNWWKSFKEG